MSIDRITHLLEQMHRSEDDAGDAIPEGKHLVTDGARGFTWEDTAETAGGLLVEAIDVIFDNTNSSLPADDVQEAIDALADLVDYYGEPGALTPDGSPATITNDSTYNAFPGIIWLTEGPRTVDSRALCVYRKGSDHASTNDGKVVGKIGTVTDTTPWTFTWGTEFDIYDHSSLDVRCEDAVSVIGGRVWVAARLYDGSANNDPFVLRADDVASELTSSTTWTAYPITMAEGSVQNFSLGPVLRLPNGQYALGVGWGDGGDFTVGIAIVDDPTDWSAPQFVTIASGANYSEVKINTLPDGVLRAHIRNDDVDQHYASTSSDNAQTWSAPASLFSATGFPWWMRLQSSIFFTVYRSDAGSQDAAWREDVSGDAIDTTYSSETILDSTGTQMEYATGLQLDPTHVLAVYGVQNSGSDSDIRSQVVTDSSTYAAHIVGTDQLVKVSSNDTTAGYLNGKLVAGTNITLTENNDGGNETLTVAAAGSTGIGEILISDTPSTPLVFADLIQNEAQDDLVYADP